jgi:hypothetical protein
MTASDEVGLRVGGHLGQPRNLRENVLARREIDLSMRFTLKQLLVTFTVAAVFVALTNFPLFTALVLPLYILLVGASALNRVVIWGYRDWPSIATLAVVVMGIIVGLILVLLPAV